MAALNLQDVCSRLSSSQVRSRQTGLNEIQRFLNQDDTPSRLGDENTYAAVLHSLIRNFSLELAAFRKSNSAQATSSLQISAECLRASTERARLFMTRPTAKVLVAHILESLPSLESPEYKIVSSSYFATLKLITSHPPHVEQMKKEVWTDLVHLCISHVAVQNWFTLSTPHHQTSDTPISDSRPFESRNTLSIRKEIVDLMLCLQSLCTFPGAPFDGEEDELFIFLVNFLATYDTQTDARMSAIIVLNQLLWHMSFNKLDLVSKASIMIVHLFSREKLWTIRVPGFQERLLITLSSVYTHLHRAASQREISATIRKAINTIVEKLMFDLKNQDPRNALSVDDLVLSVLPSSSPLWRQRPFQSLYGPYFSHNPYSQSSELTFLALQLQASFIKLLDIGPIEADLDSALPEDSPRKRRRISPDPSFQRLLIHPLKSRSSRPHRVACLQILALYLNSFRISEPSINHQDVLNILEQLSAESDVEIMNWSFVGMLGILGRLRGSTLLSTECSARWTRIWIACSKQAAIPSTCRAACAVMEAIVTGGFLRVRSLIPHINGIMEYVEQRGPGLFGDKSCDFWTSLLRCLEEEGISTKIWRSNALTRWIRFRWGNTEVFRSVWSKHVNLLPFPLLRIFTSIASDATDVLQFRHLASLPKSAAGGYCHNLASNMSLQTLLLECEINNGTQGPHANGHPALTSGLGFHDILAPIFNEKCVEMSRQLSAARNVTDISEDEAFWYTSIAILSSTFPCSQPNLTLLTALTTLMSTSKSPAHIDACLRAISQFSPIAFCRNRNADFNSGTSVSVIDIDYAPAFRELADMLSRLSGLFHLKGSADSVTSEFTEDKVQLSVSASDLDKSWALRDISRAHLTYQGWRTQALARFQSDISFESENICLLDQNSLRNAPVMNLLLAAEQVVERAFGRHDGALPIATNLLESFKTEIASTYSWGGNEMTVVTAMTIVERVLSRREMVEFTPEITNLVTQLYRWIIKVAVNRDLSSANARIRAAEFLRGIALIDVNYGNEAQVESRPGPLLIRRLQDRDIRVKFDLAEHIRSTFLCFPVAERVRTYGEIVDSLEGDERFSEGFALRAYTLMQLALTSDDIRRAAMVNLLELGNFVSCKVMVHTCFVHIAKVLYHGQLTNLFSQNSSQFINSWIEFDEDIFQFPYHVFGFTNLHQWCSSAQGELMSQLINADRWDDAAILSQSLAPFDEVVINHLPQIVSYAFLNDSGQLVGGGKVLKQCEATLGKEVFLSRLASNLAYSMSIMVQRLDDKTLSTEAFVAAGLRSSAIIFSSLGLPDPGPAYPDPPQPFFSTQRVLAALKGLRDLLGMSLQRMWSSAHVALVVRDLISNATTTSDTTVSLSCIRRIAFILCIAPDAMLVGYPFEMLVNGLNELAGRESICHEATTIIKYVFSLVSKHTSTNPQRIRYMATILISAMEELSRTSVLLTTKELIADVYDWLETLLQTVFPGHVVLRSTVQLLHTLTNSCFANNITACQVMENLITEDEVLWGDWKLRQFSLHFLSKFSNPTSETLSTIRPVVAHLLTPFNALIKPEYPTESKIWLGVALGRVSLDSQFHQPEYRSALMASKTYDSVGSTDLCPPEVMVEVVCCTRLNSKIAGLLEEGLRALPADTAFRLPSWFNGDGDIIKHLSSPNVKSAPRLTALGTPSLSDVNWWVVPDKDFTSWYKKFATSIALRLPNTFFSNFVPALNASIEFCESIFPYLIDEYRRQPRYDGSITKIFNSILNNFRNYDLAYLRLVIRNILFLRERSSKSVKSKKIPLVDEVDYLHASKAAVACTMSKTALMFLEIANVSHTKEPELERLLSEIYCGLEDPDLTYALSQGVTRSWNQLLHVFELHHDRKAVQDLRRARLRGKMELGTDPSGTDDDLLAVADQIRQNGFPLNAVNVINGGDNEILSQASVTNLYKSAWRLGIWDLPPLTTANESDPLIYTVLYQLMESSVTDPFFNILNSSITRAFDQLVNSQSPAEISSMINCLNMLADIFLVFSGPDTCVVSGREWARKILTQAEYGSYEELEASASLHNVVFKLIESQNAISNVLGTSQEESRVVLAESYLNFCEMARLCGDSNDLLVALAKTGYLELKYETSPAMPGIYPAILTERAEILWKRHEYTEAVQTLRSLVEISAHQDFTLISKDIILAKLGSWSSVLRLISSDLIVQEIFEPASKNMLQRSVAQGKPAGRVFFEYASFCTTQLEDQYVLADIKRMETLHRSKQEEVHRYTEAIQAAKAQSDQTTYKKLCKEHDRACKLQRMDKDELQRLHNSQRFFVRKAMEQYLRCFTACSDFDHYIPKFCAIWLKHSRQPGVNSIVSGLLGVVPSYKFVPLLHQLCSRLSDEGNDDFQSCLGELLSRILNDHPYHAFHQIYSTFTAGEKTATSRSKVARRIAERMDRTKGNSSVSPQELSVRLADLFSSYSELAKLPISKNTHQGNDISLSSYPGLRKFRSKALADMRLPPPSLEIPISPTNDYATVPFVQKYHHSFKIAGGVNQPKILDSVLSTGKSFRELVKGGNDDLHQDAIMQQIFQQMDGVMQRSRETRRRAMRIRTYKVIPLKPQTGVIEWVLQTVPLLEYLEKTHITVNPGDWKWSICRQRIHEAAAKDHQKRLEVYQEVCQHFKPVLRYFFLDHFRDPDSWLSRKLNYSRSVAASSMIGHVLGLGDRHGQNILLDKQTGEVVHIDLGVAFEQGKLLFVPEIVPFRLTRDIVDGFGITGCEGTFIRASTFALTVFRDEEDTISTFLDVLKYDPLYNWTISPLKMWALQQEMQNEETNAPGRQNEILPEMEADRAIQMVKRKLSSRLSAEADVRRLIIEATDEGNLSRMYCGWAAFA